MIDNLLNRGTRGRGRVNLCLEQEVRYWAEEFGCAEEQMREAVSIVGSSADRVRESARSQ